MKFKLFQRQDLARAALHDGLILSWDTGLGKTIATYAWPLLKVGFTRDFDGRGPVIRPKAPVLIIAPGDLHQQIAAEGLNHFHIRVVPLPDQATFTRLTKKPGTALTNLDDSGRPVLPPEFYITSYTQLTTNGVASLPDADDCPNPRSLLQLLCLPIGEHRDPVNLGDPLPARHSDITGRQIKPVISSWADRPDFEDVCHFFAWRGIRWDTAFSRLRLHPEDTLADLDRAYEREREDALDIRDDRLQGKELAKIEDARAVLLQLLTNRPAPHYTHLTHEQQDFIIRAFCADKLVSYARCNGELRHYPIGDPPEGYDPTKPETDTRSKWHVRCVYSPSLADLAYNAFDAVVIDEGVKMKGEDTYVGKGVRSMMPKYRLVLTATPVKNRLPDIFRLAWWAAGGKTDAHARWPYADDSSERQQFAETFMVSERNVTKEEQAKQNGERSTSRFKKLTAEVCNIHRLWKLLGPIVLRRRKQDAGEAIVPRIRKVIRCEMGTLQQRAYRYHLQARYLDKNDRPAIGAQLQALRMAAAAPASEHLQPQPGGAFENCPACGGKSAERAALTTAVEVNGIAITERDGRHASGCPTCHGSGKIPLPHRSGTDYIPKTATTLTLIQEILERKEQVVVFSAFTDPLDALGRWLDEARVRYVKLDGRVSQKQRGKLASVFKRGRESYVSPHPEIAFQGPTAVPVMLAGVECMAEGHSFHLANNVILIAYSWAYDKFKQALDRVHRMTSTKPVNVYVVLCEGSIDRKLESLVQDKGDASELCLDGRLIGERTEEVNLAELLRVAHREFDEKTKTIDEALLHAQWPTLRARLTEAMLDWDLTAGVPVATEVQTPAPAHKDVVKVQAAQSDWRARMKERAQRLAAQSRSDLWSLL